MTKNVADAEEELLDLQKRFALLQGDLKAYVEAAEWTRNHNAETVKTLRAENKKLREDLSRARAMEDGYGVSQSLAAEVRRMDQQAIEMRKALDTLKNKTTEKDQELMMLKDNLRDLQRESQLANAEDSPQTQQIRTLENRLDKAMIKYNEAMSIRKTYEQIERRLQEERLKFDSQLKEVERALKAKEQDYEELLLMSRDAAHAKDLAKTDLEKFEKMINEEKQQKMRELQEKKELVVAKQEMKEKMEQRQREKEDLHQAGSESEEDADAIAEADAQLAQEAERRINEYEEAFRKIKDATGVEDVNDVIQKFLTQEDTHNNLEQVKREAEDRIAKLHREKFALMGKAEELKYSGTGTGAARHHIEQLETQLAEATTKCERNKAKWERVSSVLMNAKAGIEHLADMLENIQYPGEVDKPPVMSDETVADVLSICEQKLVRVAAEVEDLGGSADAVKQARAEIQLPSTNTRIRLLADSSDGDDQSDDDMADGDEEVLTRDMLKRQAEKVLFDEKRKRKKKRRGGARTPGE